MVQHLLVVTQCAGVLCGAKVYVALSRLFHWWHCWLSKKTLNISWKMSGIHTAAQFACQQLLCCPCLVLHLLLHPLPLPWPDIAIPAASLTSEERWCGGVEIQQNEDLEFHLETSIPPTFSGNYPFKLLRCFWNSCSVPFYEMFWILTPYHSPLKDHPFDYH